MSTTISGTINHSVGLQPSTYSNPITVTGSIIDPNTNDTALVGGGSPTVWTIANQGVIEETGAVPSTAISLAAAGTITNTGLIMANGIGIALPSGLVANYSTIVGSTGQAIDFFASGTVTNGVNGLIQGGAGAISIGGNSGTVNNLGTLISTGLPSVLMGNNSGNANSTVINGAPGSTTALIKGSGGVGIAGVGTVTNFGQIIGTAPFGANYSYGVDITGTTSSVTNGATGSTGATIVGATFGVELSGGAGTVNNFGTITSTSANGSAVDLLNGGRVANGSAGSTAATIQGGAIGVNRANTLVNYGTIIGTTQAGFSTGQSATIVNGNSSAASWLIEGRGGIQVFATAGMLTNFGTVLGSGDVGAAFNGSAIVTNGVSTSTSGLIEGTYGINIAGSGTITNFGTIIGTAGRAVFAGAGGTLANGSATATGRQIIGTSDGVQFFLGGVATISNFGTIQATATSGTGASVRSGGNVINGMAGSTNWLISGGALGVSTATNLTNYGTIVGVRQAGVEYGSGGTIANASGAVITGAAGIELSGATFVSNSGTIIATAGNGNGVHLIGTSGIVINNGVIQAGYRGITFDHPGTVINAGTITATSQQGVFLGNGGVVNNAADKSISGSNYGVEFFIYGTDTLTNLGTITATGASGLGVALRAGGIATNGSDGSSAVLITGKTGIELYGTASTLMNFGTITGTGGVAVQFGGGNDRLVVEPGAVFNGKVDGGGGSNALELAAGSGTLTGFGTNFVNFTTATVDSGSQWTLAGNNTVANGATLAVLGNLTVNGTLNVTGTVSAATIGSGGSGIVSSGGTITAAVINGAGVLNLLSGAVASGGIAFSGPGGQLKIGGTVMPTTTISGFVVGDTVDLASVAFDSKGSATLGANNQLSITEGGNTFNLQLAAAQSFTGLGFRLAADSGSGTLITEAASAGNLITLGSSPQTVTGSVGDTIVGGTGTAIINATAGNVLVSGGSGATTVFGGLGDTVVAGSSLAVVDGSAGGMAITAGAAGGNDTLGGSVAPVAGAGPDTINGGGAFVLIQGLGTGDVVKFAGQTGSAFINATAGNNPVTLGSGFAAVYGGPGDTVSMGTGNQVATGFTGGTRIIAGSAGADSMIGSVGRASGIGPDTLIGGAANVIVQGLGAGDIVNFANQTGTVAINALLGGAPIALGIGAATVFAGVDDTVNFGSGNQYAQGLAGGTSLNVGGAGGSDTIIGSSFPVAGSGVDTLTGGAATVLIQGLGKGDIVNFAKQTGFSAINATAGNDSITMGSGAATVFAGAGDTVNLGTGNQYLETLAAPGALVQVGSAGSATVIGSGSTGAAVTVKGGAGSLLYSPGSGNTLVDLTGSTGSAVINGLGPDISAITDTIIGGNGGTTVFGGSGNRTGVGANASGTDLFFHSTTLKGGSVGFGTNGSAAGSSSAHVTVTGFAETTGTAIDFLFYQNESSATNTSIITGSTQATVSGAASTVLTLPDGTVMTLLGVAKADFNAGFFKA